MNYLRIHDAHCHIFPAKIAVKATNSIGNFYGIPMNIQEGSAEALYKLRNKAEVDHCLVCSTATKASQVISINDFIAEETRKYPDCFYGFGTLHQDMPETEMLGEIDRIISLGLHGIKLHPDFQELDIDDKRMYPAYKYLAEKSLPILFHMGDNRYDYSSAERLARIMDDINGLTAIAAHLGGYQAWDKANVLIKYDGIYFDTSSSLAFLPKETAYKRIMSYGTGRVMFGSDFPMWSMIDEIKNVEALGLSDEDLELIFYKNFERLFPEAAAK